VKRRIRIALKIAGALASVCVLFLWFVGTALTASANRPVKLPANLSASPVTIASASGAQLRGNFLAGNTSKGVIILMHGVRGNRSDMADHAQLFLAHGYSILLFDFQAHGESAAKRITSGYLESMDAAAAVAFVRTNASGEKIAILGASLGGAAAVLAEPPLQVDAMILELVYPDIDRAVKNRTAIVLGNWSRVFSPFLTWQLKFRVGVNADWLSPERKIAQINCPKLIIAGERDRHTTVADSRALYAAASEPKELWIVPNAGHVNLYAAAQSEYEKRVLAFLERTLRAGANLQSK
jgi:fermentation-respiration switch protein FrsA (DUF1100 family)